MKIFLDDYRVPLDCVSYMHQRIGKLNPIYLEEWKVVKNYSEFTQFITQAIESGKEITHVSFDHDLADEHYTPEEYWQDFDKSKEYQEKQRYKEKTGLDCARWFKDLYIQENKQLPIIFVHSMNPIGTQNIINIFKDKQS